MTTVRGDTVPEEREVPGVAGWGGSGPVRVGNAAREQVQYDALGFLLEAVSVHVQMGGRLSDELWTVARGVADHVVEEGDDEPSSGIWELREERQLVSADIGRWLCLDRAVWVARTLRPRTPRPHWKRARRQARDRVLAAILPDGRLPQAYGGDPDEADASALLIPLLRLLDRRDPRASQVVDAVLAALGSGPFLYRYEPGGDDGFSGVEGAFVPVSWWAVSALAAVGRVDEARARADALHAALPRLLAEEVDPVSGQSLGNAPLVWSHMEAARALYELHAAELRARYGTIGLGAWRVVRYLRARRRPARGLYDTPTERTTERSAR